MKTSKKTSNSDNNYQGIRKRSYTDQSDEGLTQTEKQELLNNFPSDMQFDDDERHNTPATTTTDVNGDNSHANANANANADADADADDGSEMDVIQMDSGDVDDDNSTCSEQPTKKRRRLETKDKEEEESPSSVSLKQKKLLEQAKSRLSKWSQRLFDPNRPRGLVEAPTVIPLNDEFLQNFGKREKEMDKAIGRDINIYVENLDEAITSLENDDKHDNNNQNGEQNGDNDQKNSKNQNNEKKQKERSIQKDEEEEAKVKIANLAYTTSKQRITQTCERFGPVVQVTLIMDENNENLSKGRAYVVFETMEGRESFVQNMNEKSLDGRIIRLTAIRNDNRKRQRNNNRDSLGGGGGGSSSLARYWEKDITTKCFRCGQIGHISANCPNDELQKPCPLCAKTGHDSYNCPLSKICFNCGVPGHLNRECRERKGMPRRIVCGICFMSGHHRWHCRERRDKIPSFNATCFVCGQRGHFMCMPMKWFFGLRGITCFNCGEPGHHGSECTRPNIENCARNGEIVLNELDRAGAASLAHEVEEANRKRRKNTNHRKGSKKSDHLSNRRDRENSGNSHRSRAKSQPPPRKIRMGEQSSTYGRISTRGRNIDDDRDRDRRRSRDGYQGHGKKRGY